MRNNLRMRGRVLARIQMVILGRVCPLSTEHNTLAAAIWWADLLSVLALVRKLSSRENSKNRYCHFLKKNWCHLLCCCPVLLREIPVTEDSQMSLVAKRTMQKDCPQCCCAMSKPLDSCHNCWRDRIETVAAYKKYCQTLFAPMHTATAELVKVTGLFLNASKCSSQFYEPL